MVIASSRKERGLRTEPLGQLEAEHVAIKTERTFQVGDFEMYMADADFGIDGPLSAHRFHDR